jgi:hypothetical protein
MSLVDFMTLSYGWPVLLFTGLLLGFITVWAVSRRAHLLWYLPVLLVAAIAFVLITGEAASVLILAPERLGIGVFALLPSVGLSFVLAWYLLRFGAKNGFLVVVPVVVCLASTPLAGYIARVAICELIGECP